MICTLVFCVKYEESICFCSSLRESSGPAWSVWTLGFHFCVRCVSSEPLHLFPGNLRWWCSNSSSSSNALATFHIHALTWSFDLASSDPGFSVWHGPCRTPDHCRKAGGLHTKQPSIKVECTCHSKLCDSCLLGGWWPHCKIVSSVLLVHHGAGTVVVTQCCRFSSRGVIGRPPLWREDRFVKKAKLPHVQCGLWQWWWRSAVDSATEKGLLAGVPSAGKTACQKGWTFANIWVSVSLY